MAVSVTVATGDTDKRPHRVTHTDEGGRMGKDTPDEIDLGVDEEKWDAWEKVKKDYSEDPEGIDTSGFGGSGAGDAHVDLAEMADEDADSGGSAEPPHPDSESGDDSTR